MVPRCLFNRGLTVIKRSSSYNVPCFSALYCSSKALTESLRGPVNIEKSTLLELLQPKDALNQGKLDS